MGKKRDRSALATPVATDPFLLDESGSLHVSGTEDEGPPGKKSKKHKKKKSSKKEKQDQGSDHSLNEGKSVDELAKETNVDENTFCDSDGTRLAHKTSDGSMEKGSKTPKNKSEKSKSTSSSKVKRKKDGGKAGDEDTDSEEERWLDAIESGKLEEVDDELKRMKNPRLMTARQRALMEKRADGVDETFAGIPAEPLLALPSGFKEKVLTEEMLAKKAMKNRLLKKQDPKTSKGSRQKVLKKSVPLMSYFNNKEGIFLALPDGVELPFISQMLEREAPKPVVCGGPGCMNIKKYSCSKTGVPLCSLECYKRNLLQVMRTKYNNDLKYRVFSLY
ncbi:INO80 complex subunit B [Armadillidium vulgare]|nr:INO80 complex subunit B [Armadillidium vulgare]